MVLHREHASCGGLLNIRLWPWWYFPILLLLFVFSLKWFFINRFREDYDSFQADAAARFKRMAVAVSATLIFLVALNTIGLLTSSQRALIRWLGFGVFSWQAFFSLAITAVISIRTNSISS